MSKTSNIAKHRQAKRDRQAALHQRMARDAAKVARKAHHALCTLDSLGAAYAARVADAQRKAATQYRLAREQMGMKA